ncbi:hypothetical protein RM780_13910 [Streptomyces sp. DSM 44917]|uniref:Uncharacterized protein n=1 Tax=Streptomyces boetiae TaxID=3075541 RepID=A0ABU2L996_9ACTN|nr:hypothetical protein [Streptomyces sp. DSM 44917]MDT0308051.1 hypothetical protein [Streptomyces sp. DSM 44917]
MTGIDRTGPTASRFPSIARHRPACTPLLQRVADLTDRARTAERESDMAQAPSAERPQI